MSSDLTELGQDAIAAVSRGVSDGAPLVKCQLLASAFYEALRHELRQADATKRSSLLAVTRQCHRGAAANISPVQALNELKRAVDLLRPVIPGSEMLQPIPEHDHCSAWAACKALDLSRIAHADRAQLNSERLRN